MEAIKTQNEKKEKKKVRTKSWNIGQKGEIQREKRCYTGCSLNQVITKKKMKNGNARNAMIRFGGKGGKGKRKQQRVHSSRKLLKEREEGMKCHQLGYYLSAFASYERLLETCRRFFWRRRGVDGAWRG